MSTFDINIFENPADVIEDVICFMLNVIEDDHNTQALAAEYEQMVQEDIEFEQMVQEYDAEHNGEFVDDSEDEGFVDDSEDEEVVDEE